MINDLAKDVICCLDCIIHQCCHHFHCHLLMGYSIIILFFPTAKLIMITFSLPMQSFTSEFSFFCLLFVAVMSTDPRILWRISKRCWRIFSFLCLKSQSTHNLIQICTSFLHRYASDCFVASHCLIHLGVLITFIFLHILLVTGNINFFLFLTEKNALS